MDRVVLTLLVGLMLLSSGSAHALSLNCERNTLRHDAFSTQQAFESWFPRYIRPTADDQVSASKDTQVRFQINGVIYDLTPSKWMVGKLPEKGGYKSATGVRYKCNASSYEVQLQLAATNKPKSSENSYAQALREIGLSPSELPKCKNSPIILRTEADVNAFRWSNCQGDVTAVKNGRLFLRYIGEFNASGRPNGVGVGTWFPANPDYKKYRRYIGEWKNDNRHGKGILTLADGSKQEGIWKSDVFQYARKLKGNQQASRGHAENGSTQVASASNITHSSRVSGLSNKTICSAATAAGRWETRPNYLPHVKEAKRRGLTCDVVGSTSGQVASALNITHSSRVSGLSNKTICSAATAAGRWETRPNYLPHVKEAKRRGLTCGVVNSSGSQFQIAKQLEISDFHLCQRATRCGKGSSCNPKIWIESQRDQVYVEEAKRRGLRCGVGNANQTQIVDAGVNNAELIAAQARAAELEKRLALLEAKEESVQRQIASDNQAPLLTIIQSGANGREGYLTGSVTDNVQVAEVLVDGAPISVTANGSFEWTGFVPATGKDIVVEAIDTAALSSRQIVRLERGQTLQRGILRFDELNPMSGKIAQANQNALALIVGISEYDRTNAPAVFADNDAQFFQDYAALKLGIPENNITTLLNADAGQVDVLLSVKNWLARAVKQQQSDVYVFFAGHGLASDDGEEMFLLPYDGAPELLEETTIARQKLFKAIAASNPGSVTVFLDTCYSGATRGKDVLLASRPIAIRAKQQAVPEGFTVMTAAAGDQTAKPLEEAKHGMFSYFLMKGMEGDADANQDNLITAGELHAYVQQNVIQQSSGSQTPELQGDADRVLVRFQ